MQGISHKDLGPRSEVTEGEVRSLRQVGCRVIRYMSEGYSALPSLTKYQKEVATSAILDAK